LPNGLIRWLLFLAEPMTDIPTHTAGRFIVHQFQLIHHQIRRRFCLKLHYASMHLVFLVVMVERVSQQNMGNFVKTRLRRVDSDRVNGMT